MATGSTIGIRRSAEDRLHARDGPVLPPEGVIVSITVGSVAGQEVLNARRRHRLDHRTSLR
jgi:hypothetical protein